MHTLFCGNHSCTIPLNRAPKTHSWPWLRDGNQKWQPSTFIYLMQSVHVWICQVTTLRLRKQVRNWAALKGLPLSPNCHIPLQAPYACVSQSKAPEAAINGPADKCKNLTGIWRGSIHWTTSVPQWAGICDTSGALLVSSILYKMWTDTHKIIARKKLWQNNSILQHLLTTLSFFVRIL